MYIKESLKKYLDDLASRKPAPGGGSAAALVAALGASLISMVANFTIGKEKYKQIKGKMQKILTKSEDLKLAMEKLIDEDVKVYKRLSEIYKSKQKDSSVIQVALKEAASVPFEVCRLSVDAMKLCPVLAREGNPNLISDVDVAVHLLNAAFLSGLVNVEINFKNITDKEFIVELRGILQSLEKEIEAIKK